MYRSLMNRGLIDEDPETKTVSGTLFDDFGRFAMNPNRYPEAAISEMADEWFKRALEIYNDDDIPYPPPDGWKKFLVFLKQVSLHPDRHSKDTIAYELKQAMSKYATELTAIDTR